MPRALFYMLGMIFQMVDTLLYVMVMIITTIFTLIGDGMGIQTHITAFQH